MSIFSLAKNLFERPYIKTKLKKELNKFDETIKEMVIYESINNYVKTISEYAIDNQAYDLFIDILTSDTLNSEDIIKLCIAHNHEDLINLLPENNIILSKEETELAKKMMVAQHKRPNVAKIKNIAFSGGGAKGIAHVGTLRMIEEKNLKIKAVSGTSAGAISALPFALGYKPSKIANIVSNYDFTSFLQQSNLYDSLIGSIITNLSSSKRALMYRTVYFETFINEIQEPLISYLIKNKFDINELNIKYENNLTEKEKTDIFREKLKSEVFSLDKRRLLKGAIIDKELNSVVQYAEKKAKEAFIKEIKNNETNMNIEDLKEKLSLGIKNPTEAIETFFRIYRKEDVIEEFFGDLIENKIKIIKKDILEQVYEGFSKTENIRNMSFKDFEKLRELCPDNDFKNIGICICQKVSDNPIHLFRKSNYKQIDVHSKNENKEYSEMPIKTAVRISMNLPGAFSSYEYKGKKYVDGGVRANFPLHFFDKTLNEERSTTLGFALAPEENYTRTKDVNNIGSPETPIELVEPSPLKRSFKKLMNNMKHYYNLKIYGQKLDNNNPMDQLDFLRVGFINVLNVGTNDFNVSKMTKQKLMQQGYSTCKKLLSPNYEAQINHYRERIKALYKKIVNLKENQALNQEFLDELYEMNYSNIVEHEKNYKINKIIDEDDKRKNQKFTKRIRRTI